MLDPTRPHRGPVGHEPPPQLVAQLSEAFRLAPFFDESNQPPDTAAQPRALICPFGPSRVPNCAQPTDPHRPAGPNSSESSQRFGEHAHRSFERVEHVVQRDNRPGSQMRRNRSISPFAPR